MGGSNWHTLWTQGTQASRCDGPDLICGPGPSYLAPGLGRPGTSSPAEAAPCRMRPAVPRAFRHVSRDSIMAASSIALSASPVPPLQGCAVQRFTGSSRVRSSGSLRGPAGDVSDIALEHLVALSSSSRPRIIVAASSRPRLGNGRGRWVRGRNCVGRPPTRARPPGRGGGGPATAGGVLPPSGLLQRAAVPPLRGKRGAETREAVPSRRWRALLDQRVSDGTLLRRARIPFPGRQRLLLADVPGQAIDLVIESGDAGDSWPTRTGPVHGVHGGRAGAASRRCWPDGPPERCARPLHEADLRTRARGQGRQGGERVS